MKDELSSLDLHFLIKELQTLEGARFQKVFAREKEKELFLQLHNTQAGKTLIRVSLPGLCYIASSRPDFPTFPPGFITFLRKRLAGTRVMEITQLGMDRIMQIVFKKKDEDPYTLVIELIKPGNIILIGKKPIKGGLSEEIILSLQTPQNYKDRTIRGGIPYEPPAPAANIKEDNEEVLITRVMESGMDSLVKGLAVGLNLGGTYAEIICERTKLDKNAALKKADIKKAILETKKLMEETPTPEKTQKEILFFGNGTGTISELLDKEFTNYDSVEEVVPRKQKGSILDQQLLQKKGFEESIEINQKKGELIYENYTELQTILQKVKKGEEITHPLLKKIDKKAGIITVEL